MDSHESSTIALGFMALYTMIIVISVMIGTFCSGRRLHTIWEEEHLRRHRSHDSMTRFMLWEKSSVDDDEDENYSD